MLERMCTWVWGILGRGGACWKGCVNGSGGFWIGVGHVGKDVYMGLGDFG